jgi:hypothetical protein
MAGTLIAAPQFVHLARQAWAFGCTKNAVEQAGHATVIFIAYRPQERDVSMGCPTVAGRRVP